MKYPSQLEIRRAENILQYDITLSIKRVLKTVRTYPMDTNISGELTSLELFISEVRGLLKCPKESEVNPKES
jgi:hypothetical protein